MNRSFGVLAVKPVSLLVLVLLLNSSCVKKPEIAPEVYTAQTIVDLSRFPQDLQFYAARAGLDTVLWDADKSLEKAARYRKMFFAAWYITKPNLKDAEYFSAVLNMTGKNRGYAENLQPWEAERWLAMACNANLSAFPTMLRPAITVNRTNLRLAPTARPRFVHPNLPGQGFPFDEFQQTALPIGFPLMVVHESLDGRWLYVESALTPGWVEAEHIAFISDDFRAQWETLPLAAFIEDGVVLEDIVHMVTPSQAEIGALLPVRRDESAFWLICVPGRTIDGQMQIMHARVAKNAAVAFPWLATTGNFSMVGNELLGQAYGWGGMFGNRDCSSMLRDMFTPFGQWLPRNSAAQGKAGLVVELGSLDPRDKERLIIAQGRPFQTLLYLRGHIGLYLGEYSGQAVFFHNIWGLRTYNDNSSIGRHVLGRAIISSTSPGSELANIVPESLLLNRMELMTILD